MSVFYINIVTWQKMVPSTAFTMIYPVECMLTYSLTPCLTLEQLLKKVCILKPNSKQGWDWILTAEILHTGAITSRAGGPLRFIWSPSIHVPPAKRTIIQVKSHSFIVDSKCLFTLDHLGREPYTLWDLVIYKWRLKIQTNIVLVCYSVAISSLY